MKNEEHAELLKLIRRGESQTVEFKRKVNHPEKIIREVVAFANSSGGHLFIGIDDNTTPMGLKFPEEDEFLLTKTINELCRPAIDFKVKIVKLKPDVIILHYQINKGKEQPYFAFLEKKHRYGKAFIRVEDKSIQASYVMRQILSNSKKDQPVITFDDQTKELLKYLESNPSITLSKYRELTGMNKRIASQKLISLTLSGALKIHAREGEDVFISVK